MVGDDGKAPFLFQGMPNWIRQAATTASISTPEHSFLLFQTSQITFRIIHGV
jgi:hypothetical protein